MSVAVLSAATPTPGLRPIAHDPATALTHPAVRAALRAAIDAGVRLIDLATLAGTSPAAVLRAARRAEGW